MSEQKIGRIPGDDNTCGFVGGVYQRVGLSRTESSDLVQTVLDEICDAAARGETVKLSSFGSFVVRSKASASAQSQDGRRSADLAATRDGVQAFERPEVAHQRGGVDGADKN